MKKEHTLSFSTISTSPRETGVLGEKFGELLVSLPQLAHARVIGLHGDLGAGKTTFIKGVAKGLSIKKHITSPTFVLIHRFPLKKVGYKNFFHIDAYRLSSFSEIKVLDIEDMIDDPKNILFIEWQKNIRSSRIKKCGDITFKHMDEHKRKIVITLKT